MLNDDRIGIFSEDASDQFDQLFSHVQRKRDVNHFALIKLGVEVDKILADWQGNLPIGLEVGRIASIDTYIEEKVSGFISNLLQAVGIVRFLAIFVVCAVAGALAFGFIAEANGPMVGASGVIFGLLAVITAWQECALRLAGRSRAMIWKRIAGLVAINVLLAFGLGGLLAWEAHLGGWVAGWLLAGMFRPRHGPFQAL